jgi:hypothetical protein
MRLEPSEPVAKNNHSFSFLLHLPQRLQNESNLIKISPRCALLFEKRAGWPTCQASSREKNCEKILKTLRVICTRSDSSSGSAAACTTLQAEATKYPQMLVPVWCRRYNKSTNTSSIQKLHWYPKKGEQFT